MRNFDADLVAELLEEVTSTFYLLEFQFDSTYRYTDRDVSVYYGGNKYEPLSFDFGNLVYAANMSVDRVTVDIDNVSLWLSAILLGEDVRNKTAILSFGCLYGLPYLSDDSLIGYWPLNETSGTNAPDESDNSNDGTLVNMEDADWVDGVVGKCLSFDGVNKYVDCNNAVNLAVTGSMTIGMWVNKTSYVYYGGLICKWYQNEFDICAKSAQEIRILQGDGTHEDIVFDSFTWNNDEWYYFTVVRDAVNKKLRLYVNGVQSGAEKSYTRVVSSSNRKVTIGRRSEGTAQAFNGLIDEVRIYDKALSVDEVKALYNNPSNKYLGVVDLFRGFVGDWEISELQARVTLVNEFILWKKKTLRTCSATCPWPFKDATYCKYAGAESWCDQSYNRCLALGNSANFGGFRFLPAIAERQIWWGRVPDDI